MPLEQSNLVRNGFFTYWVATNKDGQQTAVTRTLTQVFNHDGINVQLHGKYNRKGVETYNFFGKKHILATRTGGKDADAKAKSIYDKRNAPAPVIQRHSQKATALKNANKGVKPDDYATDSTKHIYGAKQQPPANTFFVIDGLGADEVKKIFTDAIKKQACTLNDDTDIVLECGAGRVWNYMQNGSIDKTSFTKIPATVYFDGTTHHVHHCDPPLP